MKMKFLFIAIVALFAATTVSAQKAASFSGHWELDTTQSKLGERARIDAMTMDVAQTAKDIKIDTKTSRPARAAAPGTGTTGNTPNPTATTANTPNPTGAGGGMGRGFGGGGDTNFTYTLDGKETTTELDGPTGPMPVKLTAKIEAGKLNLSSNRTFNGPNGEISLSTKEIWSLSPDGKTLTVSRESTSPRGTNTMELVFVKK